MADAVEMTGGEAIARMLRAHAAGPVFGMGGFQLLPFYDAARRLGLTHHLVNDERCSVFAADAYAKVSGRVGLCDATLGPGATNLVTGLVEALNAGTPLVVIIGDTHRLYSWKNMTQESRQTEILRPACKDLLRVEAVERIPELLRRAFATDRQGWEIMPDHVFTDEALSGMGVDHRPAYRRLLAAVGATIKPFDVLLVDDLSRLSRDAAEMLRLARLLEYARITLISVADGIETGTKLSKLTLSVKAIFNEQYLDDLLERTLRGLQGRFARGLHTGGRIYGYRSIPVVDPVGRMDAGGQPLLLGMELVIDPDEARIVRQIFDWFAAGVSMRAIAHRLNAEAVTFPAARTRRGAKRKGWAQSAVRVILLNNKYRGQWIFGRRVFFKDPVSGRRRARPRPQSDWQVTEHVDIRLIPDDLWQTVQARFQQLATVYASCRTRGTLNGREPGSPSVRTALFSGLLRCGTCGGSLVVINGHPRLDHRRYGCGFHRDKGSRVCPNGLSVRVGIVETRLVGALQEHFLHPAAVEYLVAGVNQHLDAVRAVQGETRRAVEAELAHVETELRNIEGAIVQGVVGKTTAALLKDREGRRDALHTRLRALTERPTVSPLRVSPAEIRACLEQLDDLLKPDSARANAVFRQILEPITMTPVEDKGRRFYRATGAAKGAETLNRLGLTQAVDFGGCGGWI